MDPDSGGGDMLPRPQSVPEIVATAENFEFNTRIRFEYWVRAAETLYQEGQIAMREHDYQRAYLMLYRYSKLLVDRIPTHADYYAHKGLVKRLFARQDDVFEQLEHIKPVIQDQYDEVTRMVGAAAAAQQNRRKSLGVNRSDESRGLDRRLGRRTPPRVLHPAEHQDLAVALAERELRLRRQSVQKDARGPRGRTAWSPVQSPGGSERFPPDRFRQTPSPDVYPDSEFRSQMEATRTMLDSPKRTLRDGIKKPVIQPKQTQTYNYPKLTKFKPVEYDPMSASVPTHGPQIPPPAPPYRPEKTPIHEVGHRPGQPPVIPQKEPLTGHDLSRRKSEPFGSSPPSRERQTQELLPDRPSKEMATSSDGPFPYKNDRISFKATAYLENGDPLRSIFLPSGLHARFLDITESNTKRGLEMCGILCGSAVNNALFISCLLIPEQKCTSDTCETENEGAVLEYCVNEDLLIIGWIHTHPTQTCFMSSRDLHTQAGYQVMMPESIAIVCAPQSEPSFGIFRLTQPPGLRHVLSCTQTGIFHLHDCDDLYTEAQRPGGHVYETSKLDFILHDLRAST